MYPHWNTIQLPWKSSNTPNILVSKVCLDHVAINMFWPVSSLFYLSCCKNTLFFQPRYSLKNTKATVENNTFPSSMKWLCHTKQQPNSLPKIQILLWSMFRWPILTDTIYIKTQVFRLLRYYSPAPRNIARSDWATQNITHNMTSQIT